MFNSLIFSSIIAILFVSFGISSIVGQESKCEKNKLLSSNALWHCVEAKKCKYASLIPAKNKVLCGVESICCPEPLPKATRTPISIANSIALKECQKYEGFRFHNYTLEAVLFGQKDEEVSEYDCGLYIETVDDFSGMTVHENEFPFMALLGYDDNVEDVNKWHCGGTLISEQFILSAAHCTKAGIKYRTVKWALLGRLARTGITQQLRYKNLFKIITRINHPLYKAASSKHENYDIALYKLERSVLLSPSIRPICLYHNLTTANVGFKATVAGWGATAPGEAESEYLHKRTIDVLDEKRCVDSFRNDQSLSNGFDKTTMICGGDLNSNGNSCLMSDSGGPMLVSIPNYQCMYLQVGIVSLGTSFCDRNDSIIYTRVSYFLPWIHSVVWSSP